MSSHAWTADGSQIVPARSRSQSKTTLEANADPPQRKSDL